MLLNKGVTKRLLIITVGLILPCLGLAGCGGDDREYADTASVEASPAGRPARDGGESQVTENGGSADDDDSVGLWSLLQEENDSVSLKRIPPEMEREFQRLADQVLESQKTDPRGKFSDAAMAELEAFLQRVEPEPEAPEKTSAPSGR